MNIYDFDGTIYNGDSTLDFYFYSLQKKISLIKYLPKQFLGFILYKLNKIDKTEFKEFFFCFLSDINTNNLVELFWNEKQKNICEWYIQQQKIDDIIISASPEFLLSPICQRLGIKYLIATEVNKKNGKLLSKNCYGEEKVRRLFKKYKDVHINQFYSDSYSDVPLAKIADNAYFVKNGNIIKWDFNK